MTKFAVLVEYDLPDDGDITFDIAARPLLDAIRELSPVPPSNVTAFADDAAGRATAATHSDLPAALLRKLAEAWTDRRPVSFAQGLYAAQATESSGQLTGIIEQHLVSRLDEQLRDQSLQLLTSTGPVWTRWSGQPAAGFGAVEQLVAQPPLTRQPREVPWKPGDPADEHDVLICRISGDSIPLLRH